MYYAIIERFGYEYMTIEKTKKAALETMTAWYIEQFKAYNDGLDPRDSFEYMRYGDSRSNYDIFIDELSINKITSGEVVSC